jgi:phage terminase large subunit
MRGGEKFWDFRTFNPPISRNNWANEYTADCEDNRQDTTLVVRNTYLDVPRMWLGEQFIQEAEELKDKNERAYIHEYLGQAIGTGGDVFPNTCDLDMEQLVDCGDSQNPMWQTFDHIYNGLDWGFAIDPTRFVRLHFDSKRLDVYIFAEYNTVKNRIQDIFKALYEEQKLVKKDELVIADSGGGGGFAIADFKAYGAWIRQAEKGPESVNYGIKWLQGLRHIYIDKRRCPYTYKEFVDYEYEQDKDGNFISAYPDENNHSIDAVRYALEKYANRKGN